MIISDFIRKAICVRVCLRRIQHAPCAIIVADKREKLNVNAFCVAEQETMRRNNKEPEIVSCLVMSESVCYTQRRNCVAVRGDYYDGSGTVGLGKSKEIRQ